MQQLSTGVDGRPVPPWDNMYVSQLNEDMYSVLMDRTEGDAWLRVKSVSSGNGLAAFVKVYKWFTGTSGQGLSERARTIMAPNPPKHEGDLSESVDKWLDSLKIVQSHRGYFLNVRLRVTALKMLMIGRAKDLNEDWEDSIMTSDSET